MVRTQSVSSNLSVTQGLATTRPLPAKTGNTVAAPAPLKRLHAHPIMSSVPARPRQPTMPTISEEKPLPLTNEVKLAFAADGPALHTRDALPADRAQAFHALLEQPDGLQAFGITNIRPVVGEKNLYTVDAGSAKDIVRSADELWRHVCLEQEWGEAQSGRAKSPSSPDPRSRGGSSATAPVPQSSRLAEDFLQQSGGQTLTETNGIIGTWGNPLISVHDKMIDMQAFTQGLAETHVLRGISGHKNNCWMRAAWVATLAQCKPDELRQRLVTKFGATHAEDIEEAVKLARSVRISGIESIMTTDGRLKPSDESVDKLEKHIEDLTLAILNKRMDELDAVTILENQALASQGRPPLLLLDREAVRKSVKDSETDGENYYIQTVMQELGADYGLISKFSDTQGKTIETIQLTLQEQSPLQLTRMMEFEAPDQTSEALRENALRLNMAIASVPLLRHIGGSRNGHFEMLLTR